MEERNQTKPVQKTRKRQRLTNKPRETECCIKQTEYNFTKLNRVQQARQKQETLRTQSKNAVKERRQTRLASEHEKTDGNIKAKTHKNGARGQSKKQEQWCGHDCEVTQRCISDNRSSQQNKQKTNGGFSNVAASGSSHSTTVR
jgi:hypothetical protein